MRCKCTSQTYSKNVFPPYSSDRIQTSVLLVLDELSRFDSAPERLGNESLTLSRREPKVGNAWLWVDKAVTIVMSSSAECLSNREREVMFRVFRVYEDIQFKSQQKACRVENARK